MPLTDLKGRAWLHSEKVKPGDKVTCDEGFDCLSHTIEHTVRRDAKRGGGLGSLYLSCADGRHYLDGQLDEDDCGALVGLYPVVAADAAATRKDKAAA